MGGCTSLLTLFFFTYLSLSAQATHESKPMKPALNNSLSLSFPLTSVPHSPAAAFFSSLASSSSSSSSSSRSTTPSSYGYRSSFKYTMALIVSLPIGTPPQTQDMVLDTGSQLSWIHCHKKANTKPPPTLSFDPSLSSSFSVLSCNHPLCKPRPPDFTLPTTCGPHHLCHYSYFYADGTPAEGNLVKEKFQLSNSLITPPLILGCAQGLGQDKGILGMNTGRLSFATQAKISTFSYCVPPRSNGGKVTPTGAFYLGPNPNRPTFRYVNLLTFLPSLTQRMPNFDPLAFTLPMVGIRIGGKKLTIPTSAFRPDAGGSGQTMIDSGTEFTFLVDEAYSRVREEVVRVAGPKLKGGYVYEGALDMCFQGNAVEIGRLIGDMVLEFEKGVEVVVDGGRMLADAGGGIHCLGIGRSDLLGVSSNIIGNFHQQNLWVEFDLVKRRVGFGKADCSRSV